MTEQAQPILRFVACQGASAAGPNGAAHAQMHRMAYWDWPAAESGDDGHLILCVHGLSRNGRDFDVLARQLSLHARVICPDVVGRGRSDWLADPQSYQVPFYVADMLTLLQTVLAESAAAGRPVTQLDWVGTSMGGLIGMAVAALPPPPGRVVLRRLVLNDVGPVITWASIQRIGTYLGQQPEFDSEQQAADYLRRVAASFGPHSDAEWLALSRPMLRPLDNGRLGLHYDPAIAVAFADMTEAAAAANEHLLWQLYDGIQAQTLLLRGAESDLLTREAAQRMTLRGPRARLVEFARVGHAPTLVHADQTAVVLPFLIDAQPPGFDDVD
ncbi:alpha/beta fold hydrolase [Corticibacter populi]|nr:alpha/beta hydrolase [Corticibacter populi]